MAMNSFDVAVVGASLAGMNAALTLANLGGSVAVFDTSSFPRRKACGEGLSVQALDELAAVGLREKLLALPHVPFYGFRFFERGRRSQLILKPLMHGVGVRRAFLDTLLVEEGSSRGIPVYQGAEVSVTRQLEGGF
jgi:hypothetical protein